MFIREDSLTPGFSYCEKSGVCFFLEQVLVQSDKDNINRTVRFAVPAISAFWSESHIQWEAGAYMV